MVSEWALNAYPLGLIGTMPYSGLTAPRPFLCGHVVGQRRLVTNQFRPFVTGKDVIFWEPPDAVNQTYRLTYADFQEGPFPYGFAIDGVLPPL